MERDKSIFLKQQYLDDLVKLRFNPGGRVAQYESADKGISMLVCRSLSAAEVENLRGFEDSSEQTRSTRQLDEILKEKSKTTLPAQNYMELKLNLSTFCALLWALFGEHCDYYRELLKLLNILDTEECFTIREAYTKEVCARITWAIINDGRSYFGRTCVATDFAQGEDYRFSVSCIDAITNEVRHGLSVIRANFPVQWITPPPASEMATTTGRQQKLRQHTMPSTPPPTNWTTSPPTTGQAQTNGQQARTPTEDFRHIKIKALMDPYLAKHNNYINLSAILTASGKTMRDMPTLPNYCTPTGTAYICWNNVLGRCFRGRRCKFIKGHVRKGEVTDEFAEAVADCIGKGVLFYTETQLATGGSPEGKRKAPDTPDQT